MQSDHATGTFLPRRLRATIAVALAVTVLLLAHAGPTEPASEARRAVTKRSTAAVTTTTRPREERNSASSSLVLPLVLAAILFLAVLPPPGGYHAHGHWHGH